jgi:nucleoside phosphorylase
MTHRPHSKAMQSPTESKPAPIDFAFITAIEGERKAVCDAFKLTNKDRVRRDARIYWRGRLPLPDGEYYEIVVAQPLDMAQVDAAILTNDIIHHWDPGALLLVGVAGAASDGTKKGEAGLGDLVVARDVYYYERGKVTAEGKEPDPTMYRADAMLWNNIISLPPMKERIPVARPDGQQTRPTVHHGVIASGEKVIAAGAARDEIANAHSKISAIEMEGYGFSAAVWQSAGTHRHLVMKAICDRADRDKTQDWQPYAAAVAAQYAKHFLKDRPLEPRHRHTTSNDRETGRPSPKESGPAKRPAKREIKGTRVAAGDIEASNGSSSLNYIPPKAHHELIGRRDELDKIMNTLRQPTSQSVVVVVGLGGIGKTALAREVAERCKDDGYFKYIVWASFKSELFAGGRVTEIEGHEYSFAELADDILRQCAVQSPKDDERRADVTQMAPNERLAAAKIRLKDDYVLLVLDNLETVPDGEGLVAAISALLGHSKLVVTSRHKLNLEAHNLELSGFTEDEGVTFLREEGKGRGIEALAGASHSTLVKIHAVTGGAPLAMKLVAGQMTRQPLEFVLRTLQEASFRGQDYDLYRFLYQNDWMMLNEKARMAWVDMSVFPRKGGAVKDVESISQVKGDEFWQAMDQLVRLSLVEKLGRAGGERFVLHPLTQNFIRSDITKEWELNGKRRTDSGDDVAKR